LCECVCSSVCALTGEYGFVMNNGEPAIYFAGRQLFLNPLIEFLGVRSVQHDRIDMGPMHIIRIPDGSCGLAMNNGNVEILLPGVHARNSTMFQFQEVKKLDSPLIELGPIHMFIVRSGTAQVCYEAGKVHIFPEGRYAVNSNTFRVAEIINTQQQNFKFSKHLVLLEGGVSMYVEGLLTFQVSNVEKLVYQLGATQLMKAIEAITEAEMVRVFAALHLEQISSPGGDAETPHGDGVDAKNIRIRICEKIVHYITPIVAAWGVNINAFQLESTTLANPQVRVQLFVYTCGYVCVRVNVRVRRPSTRLLPCFLLTEWCGACVARVCLIQYAADYEAASLQMAKAKANLRAQESQNRIMLQSAQASADSVRIAAEGAKKKAIVAAEAEAEGVKIRAQAQVAAGTTHALLPSLLLARCCWSLSSSFPTYDTEPVIVCATD
jgi:hypothetical protein